MIYLLTPAPCVLWGGVRCVSPTVYTWMSKDHFQEPSFLPSWVPVPRLRASFLCSKHTHPLNRLSTYNTLALVNFDIITRGEDLVQGAWVSWPWGHWTGTVGPTILICPEVMWVRKRYSPSPCPSLPTSAAAQRRTALPPHLGSTSTQQSWPGRQRCRWEGPEGVRVE